jgi:uncharacterized protein (TIGR00369 family)
MGRSGQQCGLEFTCARGYNDCMSYTLPHTRGCFVCGEFNPIGLRLRFETDGRVVTAKFTPRPEHAGFKRTLHGGLIATLLDEAMVWACAVQTRRFAFSAEMSVRFLRPAEPGQELAIIGELTENRRNRVFETKSELRDAQGQALASATGKYLPMADHVAAEMLTDLVGDMSFFERT